MNEPLHRLVQLRRDTARPLYLQLEEQITTLLQEKRLLPGTTLPPERQLAEALGVSRATVQNTYNALRARRLLRGEGRRGTVIQPVESSRLATGMDRLKGFTQEMRESGRVPSTRLLEREIQSDRSIASIFGLHSDARFLRLVRVRYGDDLPMTVESAWYNLDLAPMLADADPYGSIYEQLSSNGLSLDYCDQSIEATMPADSESEVLGFSQPTPCLLIKRRSYVTSGVMAEYVEGLFRGDAYVYRTRLEV
ncbi:GntR family transcriptional regulator [Flavisphingomonas formosensis]|uniref:GntR family transcriptional regulator n=1 Tax=Flavisphingomonas formosensis TaxID=861534 RepID=UPI001E58DE7B|nr:GntR family transcriptional regulator [Sphingomonas formosensis]